MHMNLGAERPIITRLEPVYAGLRRTGVRIVEERKETGRRRQPRQTCVERGKVSIAESGYGPQ
jgi:hypothetical protein